MPEPPAPTLERILARPEHGVRSITHIALGENPLKPRTTSGPRRPPVLRARLDRGVRSNPIRVPSTDWEKVIVGTKRMFRTYAARNNDRHARLFSTDEDFPRPAVIYTQPGHARTYDLRMAVITAYHQEPLGAISPHDLAAEGFSEIKQFRRYWQGRYIRWGWRPTDLISVVQLRPWTEDDEHEQARWLLERLYGEWL